MQALVRTGVGISLEGLERLGEDPRYHSVTL